MVRIVTCEVVGTKVEASTDPSVVGNMAIVTVGTLDKQADTGAYTATASDVDSLSREFAMATDSG